MIGVIASPVEIAVVREFFELFKTPWELYQLGHQYDVLLCVGQIEVPEDYAKLVVVYGSRKVPCDVGTTVVAFPRQGAGQILSYRGASIPLYSECVCFREKEHGTLTHQESRQSVAYLHRSGSRLLARIGYDLIAEVRFLLTVGQPSCNASIPALDLHIRVLRELIVESGVPLVEIPPVPAGYQFMACLTHDVDHPLVRHHKFDHTMLGFLYRSVIGCFMEVLQGRMKARQLWQNWVAALKLPFVHLGLAKDFWQDLDRYPALEGSRGSSFFVIPFKDDPGQSSSGPAPRRRAASYGAADIACQIRKLMAANCEIGLHGIDAWRDSAKGFQEVSEIRRFTGRQEIGTRMHWLYFNEQSPAVLEQAGLDYDSTVGYNDTVGYRAGTAQSYKPLQTRRLVELPLIIMDTALFFPTHLNLSPCEARERVGRIIADVAQLGGCLTVNWHDRSIAPERLWGEFYSQLIEELMSRRAWFSTASGVVSWFRKRRSAVFERISWQSGRLQSRIAVDGQYGDLPDLQLRVHNGSRSYDIHISNRSQQSYCDVELSALSVPN